MKSLLSNLARLPESAWKMARALVVVAMATGMAVGVSGCEVPQPDLIDGPDELLYFESIGLGHYGTVRDTLELVMRDEAAYLATMELVQPLDTLPEIDFQQTMVGLIALPTDSGGYIIEVQSIEKTGDEITINYLFSIPGADCITLQALALPFQVVIIRQSEGHVTFERETKAYKCGL